MVAMDLDMDPPLLHRHPRPPSSIFSISSSLLELWQVDINSFQVDSRHPSAPGPAGLIVTNIFHPNAIFHSLFTQLLTYVTLFPYHARRARGRLP